MRLTGGRYLNYEKRDTVNGITIRKFLVLANEIIFYFKMRS